MKILIVEDDQIFGETLKIFLELEGYEVFWVTTIEEAENITFDEDFDLYLLDINLPDGKGLTLLQRLRYAEDNTPTIFITALTDLNSMSEGFKLGAVDYIKKPFEPEELLIRIRSKFDEKSMRYGNISYNHNSKIVTINKKVIDLGAVPTKVFAKLINSIGSVVSRDELLDCLEQPSSTALRVVINKIKKILSIEIKNIRSRGYMLEEL